MENVTLKRNVKVWQFNGQEELPADCYRSLPEVERSLSKDLIYFTFPTFRPSYWMSVVTQKDKPVIKGFENYVLFTHKDKEPYYRVVFPFSMYEIKSSHERRVEYIDEATVALYADYALMHEWSHEWSHEWPAVVEHREPNGSYGRGFIPTYVNLTDWLIINPSGKVEVVTNEKYQELTR